MTSQEINRLSEQLRLLELENELLRKERDFFRRMPMLAQGLKGETLVAHLTGGSLTGHKVSHDLTLANGALLEVKYSHVNRPGRSATRRWNWGRVLGSANTKKYDYLVLVGEKDPRYDDQYPVGLECVFFLVPRSEVDLIRTGMDIAINTNLRGVRATKSLALMRRLVKEAEEFKNLLMQCHSAI